MCFLLFYIKSFSSNSALVFKLKTLFSFWEVIQTICVLHVLYTDRLTYMMEIFPGQNDSLTLSDGMIFPESRGTRAQNKPSLVCQYQKLTFFPSVEKTWLGSAESKSWEGAIIWGPNEETQNRQSGVQ